MQECDRRVIGASLPAYHAERQLVKALPRMAKAATSPDLRTAFQDHLTETEEQIARLEQAFGLLDEPVKAKVCAGMQGILEEGSDLIKEEDKGNALDAGLIASAQRAEHYEMAAYGSLVAWATALGHEDVAELLSMTLEEEKATDLKLTALAESGINAAAAEGDEDDEESEEPAMAGAGKGKSAPARTAKLPGPTTPADRLGTSMFGGPPSHWRN